MLALSGPQPEVGNSPFVRHDASRSLGPVKRRPTGRCEYEVVNVLARVDQTVAKKTTRLDPANHRQLIALEVEPINTCPASLLQEPAVVAEFFKESPHFRHGKVEMTLFDFNHHDRRKLA
jgi:hypothetical protein